MNLLEFEHLRKSFDDFVAVDDVGFSVGPGEVFGLLGPNGAGKSTTMMMLAGLLEPDSGTITLEGRRLNHHDRARRKSLGVVPQDLSVYPNLSARENLYFFGRLYGVPKATLKQRMDKVLDRIGLTDRADDLTETFSGGMKRRLNFGAALLHEPRLLILDEPTVGVDPQSRAHLLNCIRDLSAEGVAVLYASHYMEEVEAICSRIAIIDHGKMIACDRISALLAQTDSVLTLFVDRVNDEFKDDLEGIAGVEPARNGDETPRLVITLPHPDSGASGGDAPPLREKLSQVLSISERHGIALLSIDSHEANLERLFLQLTGNRLRD